jgi:casein kinase II subunit alpha
LISVLIRQLAIFGPLPTSYATLITEDDSSRWDVLVNAEQYIQENDMVKPFALAQDECLTAEDKNFILKIMKIDPRDRPTAKELLADKWFDGVSQDSTRCSDIYEEVEKYQDNQNPSMG